MNLDDYVTMNDCERAAWLSDVDSEAALVIEFEAWALQHGCNGWFVAIGDA